MNLVLPETKLRVREGRLVRLVASNEQDENNATAAEIPLDQIHAIRVVSNYDFGLPVILSLTSLAISIVLKIYIPSVLWGWLGGIVFIAIASFSVLLIPGRKIVIETEEGVVSYVVADQNEEAEGFVVALRNHLAHKPDVAAE